MFGRVATPSVERKEPRLSAPVSREMMTFSREDAREIGRAKSKTEGIFTPYKPLKGVIPDAATSTLAMDSAFTVNYASALNNMVADGVAFLGYPRLAEMAQRVEYRHIVETLADEATREWIEFKAVGDQDKKERIKELADEFERLCVCDVFNRLACLDGFYGVGQLYLDTGLDRLSADLGTPLLLEPETFPVGSLKALTPVEPVWTSPNEYNAADPLRSDFYRPTSWWVQGANVHHTRLIRFVSRELTQLLAPSYNFGGLPLTQIAKPYVDNWVRTRQSVSDLINGCSIVNLQTDMSAAYQTSGIEGLINRIESFIKFRDNRGVFLTEKEKEDLQILSANLSGLDKLQNQALEQICVVAQMPLVKFAGISPSGLNASSEGEIRVWYDRVKSYQESFFRPGLRIVMQAAMLSLWGEIDPGITFDFIPLWQMDEAAKAAIEKTKADIDAQNIEAGVISNSEGRRRQANDPDSIYAGIDLAGPGFEPLAEEEGENAPLNGGIEHLPDPASADIGRSGV